MLERIMVVTRLKMLPRMGWLLKGIPNPESIADHSYMVAFITLLLAENLKSRGVKVNTEKALKLAIVHDIAEAVITDLPLPAQLYLNKEEAERLAFKEEFPEFMDLFEEYRRGNSIEAQLVKLADRIDMVIQAYIYGLSGSRNLGEFWKSLDEIEKLDISKYFSGLIKEIRRLKRD
ncbi:HD domain-containing protein [Pyrococcus kukulkanii]|uniref:5'-deoxynucleotidase n=2 Tax=Pyrococcus kukulkanii TaxID=1609559 RepID=A0A127B8G0_9EURY|nr:HD family hydrolase [Pyrococcus kukulkanii]AMM53663.1 oxetanocin [Pyrococcus kukulkanii]